MDNNPEGYGRSSYQQQAEYRPGPRKSQGIVYLLLVVLSLFALVAGSYFVDRLIITRDGVHKESQLNAEYLICMGRLSQYYVNGPAAIGIANANKNAIDQIIKDSSLGRHGTAGDLQSPANPVYQAIYQAYPDTGSVAGAYKAAAAVLIGEYNNYVEENGKLFTMLSDYDEWRLGLQGAIIAQGGFPSKLLSAGKSIGAPRPRTRCGPSSPIPRQPRRTIPR